MKNSSFLAVLIFSSAFAVIAIWFLGSANVQAPAGYAAYLIKKPIFGSTSYQGVLAGPSSSGRAWRLSGDLVSVTPYSYSEEFAGVSTLIANDKLPIIGGAHIVWRIRSGEKWIKTYMEQYGGLDERHAADETALESYKNYIKEPFRTLVREEFAKYAGLAIPDNLAAMGRSIQGELDQKLKDTPFEVLQVVIGNAQPPKEVLDQVALKIAKSQELARKETEQQIANKNKEIEKANGEAAGERELAIATKRALANTQLSNSITPQLIQYLAVENLKTAEKIYLPVGAGGIPIVADVNNLPASAPNHAGAH